MNAPLTHEEWLAARRKGIGGSDIGPILGVSPFKGPVQVWLEKTGRAEPDDETIQQRFGKHNEAFVADEYARYTGLSVQRVSEMFHHPEHSHLLANIDRLVAAPGKKRAVGRRKDGSLIAERLLECKTAHPRAAAEFGPSGSDIVPLAYSAQAHWYRIVTGIELVDLAVLIGNSDFRVYHLPRDPELDQLLVHVALRFWEDHVLADVPPPPKSLADLGDLFPADKYPDIAADEPTKAQVQAYHDARKRERAAVADKEQAEFAIKGFMGEHGALTVDGEVAFTWKAGKPVSRINADRVRRTFFLMPGVVEQLTVTKPAPRRFVARGVEDEAPQAVEEESAE